MGTAPSSRARPCRAFSPFHPFPTPSRGRRDVLGTERRRGRLSQPITFSHPSYPEADSRDPRDSRDPSCFSPKEGAEHRRGTRRWPRSHGKGSATRNSSCPPPRYLRRSHRHPGAPGALQGSQGGAFPVSPCPAAFPGGAAFIPREGARPRVRSSKSSPGSINGFPQSTACSGHTTKIGMISRLPSGVERLQHRLESGPAATGHFQLPGMRLDTWGRAPGFPGRGNLPQIPALRCLCVTPVPPGMLCPESCRRQSRGEGVGRAGAISRSGLARLAFK